MPKLLRWLDDNILTVLSGFLLVFIPLYPKLPLLDVLPGYIVRVRLEDFFVAFSAIIWFIWLVRKKVSVRKNPLVWPIAAYFVAGILSILSAIFITGSIPMEMVHIQKTLLHFFRRVEYISLFFIFYSSVKSMKTIKIYVGLLFVCAIAVALYGFGQRYYYWPAFSTMNREFAKGWVLYLTEHARVLSTFGGHYDLAAYTMMVLVFFWSLFFGVRRVLLKAGIFLLLSFSFWLLILTASRTSFLAYLAGLTVMFFFWMYRHGVRWAVPRYLSVVALSIFIMLSFGDLSERFTKLLRINERLGGIKSLLLSPIGAPPRDRAIFLENNPDAALAQITSKSDQPPTPRRPSDVFQDIPLMIPSGSDSASISAVSRTYSKTAFQYDLSTAIRFDALWPMAIAGFKKNPVFGTGYATLNKTQVTQFTDAESTDNDYLRALGETGLAGFLTFYFIIGTMLYILWRSIPVLRNPILFSICAGVSGLIFGLLVNAVYIDVFESSKVAFSFWALCGFTLAGVSLVQREKFSHMPLPVIPDFAAGRRAILLGIWRFLCSDRFFILIILILAFWVRMYKIRTPLADWHSWRQADTSSVTRNYVKNGINLLYPTYHDLSNIASGKDNPKGLRYVEFPLYNAASVVVDKLFVGYTLEISGRLTSIFASLGTLTFLFLLVRKYRGRFEAHITAFFFAVLPYSIFYSRVILPEPFLVFCSTGMVYFFDKWIGAVSGKQYAVVSWKEKIQTSTLFFFAVIFTIAAVLVKPFAVFLFLPMAYLWLRSFGYSIRSIFFLFVYLGASLLPFLWWRWWIGNFPEGIPANTWLLNGDGIRFKGAFFQWIFADRIGRMILGYWGLPVLFAGLIARRKSEGWLFFWWTTAVLSYLTVFATGNVRHDYYQSFTIPIICILLARGVGYLVDIARRERLYGVYVVLPVAVVFSIMFGWYHIRDFYNVNHPEIVDAGRVVETKTHEDALVIAPYNGDTAFLYQTKRAGWPMMQDTVDKMIKRGADYYISTNFDDQTKQLMREALTEDPQLKKYKIIDLTDKYVLIQLVPDRELPKRN